MAADHYVRADAAGNNDGSDWTNAYTALPATLDRGDSGSTYYIADGNYEGYLFNSTSAAIDGTKVITIKKATTSAHGTDTGWNSSHGDGQAVFKWSDHGTTDMGYKLSAFKILSSYITIDGSVGSGGDIDNYGFKMMLADGFGDNDDEFSYWNAISIGGVADRNKLVNDIIIRHVGAEGPGKVQQYRCIDGLDGWGCSNNGISTYFAPNDGGGATNITIDSVYMGYWNNNITIMGTNSAIVNRSYLYKNIGCSAGTCDNGDSLHTQNANIDGCIGVIISNNNIVESREFAVAFHSQQNVGSSGIEIYNNLFYGTNPSMSGFIATMTSDVDTLSGGLQVHHNTVFEQLCGGKGFVRVGTLTDTNVISYVYNNLLYNSDDCSTANTGYTQGVIIHDYNAYLNCTNYTPEDNAQVDATADDPFVDSANGDYRLNIGTLPINNGKTDLGATYAHDYAGTERGASPDIGAYEYVGTSDVVAPAAPSGLAVT